MKTKNKWIGLSIFLALILIVVQMPAVADAEEEASATAFEVELKPGFEAIATSDLGKTPAGVRSNKVGEYKTMDKGVHPTFEFSLTGNRADDYLGFGGTFIDDEEQSYYLDVDFRRRVRQSFEYDRFRHWLDHDPLENLNAVYGPTGNAGKDEPHVVTTHTDFDSEREYQIIHSEIKSNTAVALPFIPGGEISLDYRKEMREGHRQSLTMSKCSACHVQSHSREIDEQTEDFRPSIKAKFGQAKSPQLALEYSYLYREFQEKGATPTNLYDDAVNPRDKNDPPTSRPFGDRLWYQNEELEYDQVPEMEKQMHTVKAQGLLPGINSSLSAAYVNSNVENTDYNLETDSDTAFFRISNTSIRGLALDAGFRWMEIDNDDILIDYDLPERPVPPPTPEYGGTYQDGYPDFQWPYNRKSALSRDEYRADFNARYTIMPGLSVRAGYEWKKTDREDFLVADDETETQMDTYKLGVNGRLGPVRARVRYTYQDIDHPFANSTASPQGGACEAYGEQPPTGGNWRTGLQYFQFWETRTEDMSNVPEKRDEIVANVTYPIKYNLSLTGNYRWVDEDTTSGEGEVNMPSVSLWYAPNPKLSFTLTYLYDDETRESRICVPVFNG
jgi:hypothetical protein